MPTRENKTVGERVRDTIREEMGLREECLTPDSRLVDDLGFDSLDRVELVMAIEEDYDIDIPDEAAENFRTVSDIMKYVEEHPTT
jgi:acyl carrier protein